MSESQNPFPNFLESLFFGEIKAEALNPYPIADEEKMEECEMYRTMQQKFIEENIDAAKIDQEATIPMELINKYAEIGLFSLTIPEEYDGGEAPYSVYCKVYEDLTRADASFSTVMGGHQSLAIKPLLLAGSDEQKKRWLPDLATGELIGAFALTEPSAGSDVHNLKSIAEPSEDGSHYILNGEKLWITNGAYANFFTYFTRIPRKQEDGSIKYNIGCFVLTKDDMEGITTGPPEKKMGLKGSATTTVVCQNVKVPKENLIGGENDGFMLAMQTLNYGRLSLAAGTIGVMKEMVKLTREFAEQRVTFGKKIINHGMVTKMIAEMEIDTFVSEALAYLTAGNVDRGQPEFQLESAASKTFCTEACWRVVNNAVQINAGLGYMSEYPFERALRDSRINLIFEGTNEIQRMFIALFSMKQIGKAFKENTMKPASVTKLVGMNEKLHMPVERFDKISFILADNAKKIAMKYGKQISGMQLVQQRLADIAINAYACAAAISKTNYLFEQKSTKADDALRMTEYFTYKALKEVENLEAELLQNQDELLLSIAKAN